MSEWFTPAEMAEKNLPDMPDERAIQVRANAEWRRPDREGTHWRRRAGQGGGYEYHLALLPRAAQVQLALAGGAPDSDAKADIKRAELSAWFDRQPERKKAVARARAETLDAIDTLVRAGLDHLIATLEVARSTGSSRSTLYRWRDMVAGLDRADWAPALAPRHAGGQARCECPDEAWEALKADYLRLERPAFTDCHRRLVGIAAERGWTLPSASTLQRRMEALPGVVLVLARDGVEALRRMYPAQQRTRDHFHALQAVNADGHKWDVFVRWPGGPGQPETVLRPQMVAIQDLFSGMILAWRLDRSANKEAVRLAIGDMVEQWGIPSDCWLDNGRDFASKWITGGIPNRYRFRVTEEEPSGLLTQLGVAVHWTTPYSGQSKPIERAFRDMAGGIAKHPAFAGAYVGNTPMAKPENYGSKAVPLDVFIKVVGEGIAEHNARIGRRSAVCGGKLSFLQAFTASYGAAESVITKATPEQRRLWLLAAELIQVNKVDGSITLEGNRFWADFLHAWRGQRVTVRFDPQALQEKLHVYRPDGGFLGSAPCVAATGFDDVDAAKAHQRARRSFIKGAQQMEAAAKSLSLDDLVAMQARVAAPPEPPDAKVVRPVFRAAGNLALKPHNHAQPDGEQEPEHLQRLERVFEMQRAAGGPVLEVVGGRDAGEE